MSLKSYNKNLQRMYKVNILRLLAIGFIIAIGIAVATGIGSVSTQIRDSIALSSLSPADAYTFEAIADKIELVGAIIPFFFIAVSMLVTLTTIARLVEEERSTVACYRTLGYSNFLIICRYIVFAFTSALMGCILGLTTGNFILRPTIFNAAAAKFSGVISPNKVYFTQGIIWSVVMLLAVILTALIVSLLLCRKSPAELLRPKSPKPGKKIFLERITFFWKRLHFKFKSSIRNIFRFRARMIMTVLSVAGATIMLWVGFGLFASIDSIANQGAIEVEGFIDSMKTIATIMTISGITLAILVLFNLTNINIEERRREIATLKVLGYKQLEVAGFIYREVLILSVVGILIGLPCGYFLDGFLFEYLEFGSLSDILWYNWLVVALIAFASVVFASLLLYRKMAKIEMVSSLKTVE